MTSAEIAGRMVLYSNGNVHDIDHFLKVYAFAKIIGECEKIDEREQLTLEAAAIVHDIACPLCREKYGDTNGKHQEAEGEVLARDFLSGMGLPAEMVDRVAFLVGHHHTYVNVDGADYQILLEADYLVNAAESSYPADNIRNAAEKIFRTRTGTALLRSIYGIS
jgi:HD superfamily phosphodiesterase